MLAIRIILHPTDFSEQSTYAFRLACALARDHNARLIVLHVATAPVVAYGEGVLPVDLDLYAQEAAAKLDKVQPPDLQVQVEHRLLVEAEPVSEILRQAAEEPCDLIVVGTHGRTGFRRVLMGSVAEQVVRKATCPVLTVKTPFPVETPATAPAAEPVVAAR
jgi:nucleotide-binding universal stress UspA family protein